MRSSKDLFSAVAAELGWKEVDVGPRTKTSRKSTIYCVMQSSDLLERLPQVPAGSWVSRYPGMPELCDKGNFARMVKACGILSGEEAWSFVPKTWVLPQDLEALREAMERGRKRRTYIVKPEDGSQGDGIFMVQSARELEVKLSTKANAAAVCQEYVSHPLLLGGFKFDLRLYVLVAGGSSEEPLGSPPLAFLCREGLVRFCTQRYEEPAQQNLHKCMAHLTNYSLNKRGEGFVHAGETLEEVLDPGSGASKRPLTAVLRQLEAERPGFQAEAFYQRLAELLGTASAAMAPVLAVAHRAGQLGPEMRCFQLLGFDVMLDRHCAPHLLEVNNSPSLCIDELFALEPGEEVANAVKDRRADRDRPCLCMEMSGPHRHQTSVVDLLVKKAAMCGAFRLLEQLGEGSEGPEDDAYIPLDLQASGDGLHSMLCRVEALYRRCGGAPKAFTSAAMRRHLAPLAGQGGLEKHDFDALSQRLRTAGTHFTARDPGAQAYALRLFDFLDVLAQLSARAFHGQGPREALESALNALNV